VIDKILLNYDKLAFQEHLLRWYDKNKRILPWRKTKDPYKIWVSEIMLQQTKVDTVINYYTKFIEMYPTIVHLAEAEEQEVLKLWEGLGYYSRARNLHAAAKEVVKKYDGIIPNDPAILGTLKGIGPYTRGAISSIAFGLPEPAVDGNVMRVLSRALLIKDNISEAKTRKRIENIVRELIPEENPSAFNQGLMELGALICTPRSPACMLCPVQTECRAFNEGVEETLPVKLKKKKQRIEPYSVFVIENEAGEVAIEQRPNQGLLANMWQFPMVENELVEQNLLTKTLQERYELTIDLKDKLGEVRHVFSHTIWELDVYAATTKETTGKNIQFVAKDELEQYPFSVSHLKIREWLYNQ